MGILKVKENRRHIKIILYMVVAFAMTGFGSGSFAVTVLYGMGAPLCLSPEDIGLFLFGSLMSAGVGSMIGGAILPFCLSTFGMMYVSYLSNQAAFVATALAKTEWYLLLGACLGAFRLLALPIVRTDLSKMVKPDEQGKERKSLLEVHDDHIIKVISALFLDQRRVGDIILSVSGTDLTDLRHTDAVKVLKASASAKSISFRIIEADENEGVTGVRYAPSWLTWLALPP
ncbi:putative proton-coupled folate transporter [Apostichopus japonicus]|uniref:Putative proton-coupled folate transporter n=1 Tax=Stichopus japonicus TaxID=307972 RepID=A0A2G8JVX5_STIJA|nr:putative proton-coupled folate transporter [Apostichopus japonicus]